MKKMKRKLKNYNWELIIIIVAYLMSILLVVKLEIGAIVLRVMFILIVIGVIVTTIEQAKYKFKNK